MVGVRSTTFRWNLSSFPCRARLAAYGAWGWWGTRCWTHLAMGGSRPSSSFLVSASWRGSFYAPWHSFQDPGCNDDLWHRQGGCLRCRCASRLVSPKVDLILDLNHTRQGSKQLTRKSWLCHGRRNIYFSALPDSRRDLRFLDLDCAEGLRTLGRNHRMCSGCVF